MTGLQVTLDFTCHGCDERVNVTVLCQGKPGGPLPFAGAAMVNVPCPTCAEVNQVSFESDGALVSVRRLRRRLALPVPSIN